MFQNPNVNLSSLWNSCTKIAGCSSELIFHVSLCGQQHPKCEQAIRLVYSTFFCKYRSWTNLTNKSLKELEGGEKNIACHIQTALSR
jgi:hypothetical protein